MMQFKEKIASACTEMVQQCKSSMNYNILGLKILYLKSELDNSLFDKAQKRLIFKLWSKIAAIFY